MKTEPLVFESNSTEETEKWAGELASKLPSGSVLALHGNLGAGKTVFARGFARGLGITEPISSPTFTIVQEYPYSKGMFYHLDLYRIDHSDSAYAFGIDEFLYDPDAMTLIEWPERIADILPETVIHVTLEALNEMEDKRRITVEFPEKKS